MSSENNAAASTGRFGSRMNRAGSMTPNTKTQDVELGAAAAASTPGTSPATARPRFVPVTTPTVPSTTTADSAYAAQPAPAARPVVAAPNAPVYPPPAPTSAGPLITRDPVVTGGSNDGGIPNEPEDEPEDEDPNQPEETKEEKKSIARMPGFLWLILDILLAAIMLVPFFMVYLFRPFPWYNIIEVKGPVDALNPFMEFFRWSIFCAIAYASYSILDFILGALPTHLLRVFNKFEMFTSKRAKRQVGYLRNIHPYMTACVFFLLLLWLGGIIVYSANPTGQAISLGPLSAKPAAAAAGGAAAGATTVVVQPVQDSRYYVERFLILAAILAGAIAFEKYLLEAIRAKFHRMALAVRIKDINYRQAVIKTLESKVSSGPHISASRHPGLSHGAEDIYLTIDAQLGMTSLARARSIASKIFNGAKNAAREYLIKEDFERFFVASDVDAAFASIDTNRNGEVDEQELTEVCETLFEDIQNIRASLVGNARIVGKLDRLLLGIALIIGLAIAMPFFDVGLGKAWATFGVISTAFGFMFQNAGKICFESLIFVFVEHAFDVGDRVTVDGENMVVQNIEIFTTRFVRWDGVIVYVPNAVLSGKYIFNVRRSGMQSDQIVANISAETSTEQLRQVLVQLKEKTLEDSKDFTGFVDIVEFNVIDEKKMEVKFTVQYKSNFQNQAHRNARKTKFNCFLKEVLAEQSIQYFPAA